MCWKSLLQWLLNMSILFKRLKHLENIWEIICRRVDSIDSPDDEKIEQWNLSSFQSMTEWNNNCVIVDNESCWIHNLFHHFRLMQKTFFQDTFSTALDFLNTLERVFSLHFDGITFIRILLFRGNFEHSGRLRIYLIWIN